MQRESSFSANDEWILSNVGFGSTSYARVYALNVASFLAPKGGKFLCYSDNFGLTGSILDSTLRNAGYHWRVSTILPFTLDTLLSFDAVWLAGFPPSPDTSVLAAYVKRGGKVYLCGGTHTDGQWTSNAWNGFLRQFGLSFSAALNNASGNLDVLGSHPILAGVRQLYHLHGNGILVSPGDPQVTGLIPNGGAYLFAVHIGVTTSTDPMPSETPRSTSLYQNYPNPFNPGSDIRYQISEFSIVHLAVYDLLGREVAVLVNEQKPPGTYQVRFDGSSLPSGVYFYHMRAGQFTDTKRLLLLK